MGNSGSVGIGAPASNDNSSPKQPAGPPPPTLFISRDVTDRWEAVARKDWEEKRRKEQDKPVDNDLDKDKSGDERGGGGDASSGPLELEMGEDVLSTQEIIVKKPENISTEPETSPEAVEEEKSIDVVAEVESPVASGQSGDGHSETLQNLDSATEITPLEETEAAFDAVSDAKESESDEEPIENMEKFTKLLCGNESYSSTIEQSVDVENGTGVKEETIGIMFDEEHDPMMTSATTTNTTVENYSIESSVKLSYHLPEFEEVNEFFSINVKTEHGDLKGGEGAQVLIEEKAFQNTIPVPEYEQPFELEELPIPKSVLPVVIDQDETGIPTIQTIRAWKVKEELEMELDRNNDKWTDEIQRLTAKVADSTMEYANNVEKRVKDLEAKYPDIIASNSTAESSLVGCNMLTTRIGDCYTKNKDELLKCNDLIRQFAQCTSKSVKEKFMSFAKPDKSMPHS